MTRALDRLGAKWLRRTPTAVDATPLMKTQMLEIDGHRARVAVVGDGPLTVLALHGYPDTLQIFSRLALQVREGERLVAVDFPGQGHSEPRPTVVSPRERAAWLVKVLNALNVGRVRALGHDMGAMSALMLASLAPERVERVVVMNALLSATAPTSAVIWLLRWSSAHRVLLPAFPRSVVARCCEDFLPASTPLSAVVREDLEQAFTRPSVTATTVAVCDAAEKWLRRGVPMVTPPVLALWSRKGGHFPREHAEVMPDAKIVEVEGGRHWLAWQSPELVWSHLVG